MTVCIDGVAYIFMRWVGAFEADPNLKGNPEGWALDFSNWQVWGAYNSTHLNPAGNANRLGQYGLDLEGIALSSFAVQEVFGPWATNTTQSIINAVENNIDHITLANTMQWKLASCDLDAVLNGQHFNPQKNTVVSLVLRCLTLDGAWELTVVQWSDYIACSCVNMTNFPLTAPKLLHGCGTAYAS